MTYDFSVNSRKDKSCVFCGKDRKFNPSEVGLDETYCPECKVGCGKYNKMLIYGEHIFFLDGLSEYGLSRPHPSIEMFIRVSRRDGEGRTLFKLPGMKISLPDMKSAEKLAIL